MSYGELEAGLVRENNDLQARLAQCEREREQEAHGRKLYSDELNRAKNRICQEAGIDPERGYEAGITALKAERDAALERFGKLTNEARSYVTNRMYYSREEATKDLDKREKILIAVIEESEKALLALRAGSVTNGGSAQQIRREVGG